MPFTLVFKWTAWMCYLSHTGETLVTIILLTLCERLFSGIEMLWWFFPSFVLFYNRHISLKLAYIEEKVMICECDGYKWMGPSLSSVALTTSTVEDRFSFTGNKDIREHFVFRLRIQPWIGLSCIRGRHSSASFLTCTIIALLIGGLNTAQPTIKEVVLHPHLMLSALMTLSVCALIRGFSHVTPSGHWIVSWFFYRYNSATMALRYTCCKC